MLRDSLVSASVTSGATPPSRRFWTIGLRTPSRRAGLESRASPFGGYGHDVTMLDSRHRAVASYRVETVTCEGSSVLTGCTLRLSVAPSPRLMRAEALFEVGGLLLSPLLAVTLVVVVIVGATGAIASFYERRDLKRREQSVCRSCSHVGGRHLQNCPEAPWR